LLTVPKRLHKQRQTHALPSNRHISSLTNTCPSHQTATLAPSQTHALPIKPPHYLLHRQTHALSSNRHISSFTDKHMPFPQTATLSPSQTDTCPSLKLHMPFPQTATLAPSLTDTCPSHQTATLAPSQTHALPSNRHISSLTDRHMPFPSNRHISSLTDTCPSLKPNVLPGPPPPPSNLPTPPTSPTSTCSLPTLGLHDIWFFTSSYSSCSIPRFKVFWWDVQNVIFCNYYSILESWWVAGGVPQ
uniref:Uncharacterized protein n=1 Tax=Paramormyrops kingsleyae TaxID=1676925 RepID=A0A3B3SHI8_9TELE